MINNQTITLTVHNRPQYLKSVLKSLSRVHKIEEWQLFIGLEPENGECAYLCDQIDFMPRTILRNQKILGVRENPYQLLTYVFNNAASDINIYLEDDTEVSPDITDLALWYARALKGDQIAGHQCAFLGLFTTSTSPDGADELLLTRTFLPWGLVFNAHQWRMHIEPYWWHDADRFGNRRDWTLGLTDHLLASPELTLLAPRVSRVRNIGRDGGVHPNPTGHDLYCRGLVINEQTDQFKYWINHSRSLYWRSVYL